VIPVSSRKRRKSRYGYVERALEQSGQVAQSQLGDRRREMGIVLVAHGLNPFGLRVQDRRIECHAAAESQPRDTQSLGRVG
jgi:hypothetical protein